VNSHLINKKINNITYDKYKKKWLNGELGITQVSHDSPGEELAAP